MKILYLYVMQSMQYNTVKLKKTLPKIKHMYLLQ